ncbi:hypothetical protein [Bacillus toyonensis]|uniref:hypothetical protein n=1 Tax=Bacillus toyonensis TaxID=155322 RepID=UPI000BFD871C|nr:hypothetical protein [Bacillus toyonensis]PHG64077.1 hypothetical protein COI59_17235 [Bacillus toyonensis]
MNVYKVIYVLDGILHIQSEKPEDAQEIAYDILDKFKRNPSFMFIPTLNVWNVTEDNVIKKPSLEGIDNPEGWDKVKKTFFLLESRWDYYNDGMGSVASVYLDFQNAIQFAKNAVKTFLKEHGYLESDLVIETLESANRYQWWGYDEDGYNDFYIHVIPDNFVDDISVEEEENKRVCNVCRQGMVEGYCIDDGLAYYCSEECLHKEYTPEEYEEMYEDDYAYWTQWEE